MEMVWLRAALLGLLLVCVTTAPINQGWKIYSFNINSTVSNRYATTTITSRVANPMEASQEIEFHVQIPKNAIISKFRMVIEKKTYDGVVKQKEEAEQQYSEAVARGHSAGIVSSVGRTLENFKTSVTVAAGSKVTFELTYEELLKRRLGVYALLVHARPMQPVEDFKMDVYINEKAGISLLSTSGGFNKTLADAITKTQTADQAWIKFYPTVEQQTACDDCGETGLNGDLVVIYDVNRADSIGDIVESGGYFVHHFAPENLPRIPKNVVFIIDRSGSMHGRKMLQTREAMLKILGDLAEDDYFGLITFDSHVSTWRKELVPASQDNLSAAKLFAGAIQDGGATDINAAVLKGAELLNGQTRGGSASLLILLTDGDPTSGEVNREKIQANVRGAISKKFPLYCLGFGFDVNFEFLSSMSLENNGVARRIYQESDAALQLQGFYEEVATPLLTDVQMIYLGGANLTQTNFSQYYKGSEIVVAGQVTSNEIDLSPQVIAISKSRKMEFVDEKSSSRSKEPIAESRLNRLWAYLTVKQLLDTELQYSGPAKAQAKKVAVELALQYGFVTPHTSMVVTKPEGEDTQVAHKPQEGEKPGRHSRPDQHSTRSSSYTRTGVHDQRFRKTQSKAPPNPQSMTDSWLLARMPARYGGGGYGGAVRGYGGGGAGAGGAGAGYGGAGIGGYGGGHGVPDGAAAKLLTQIYDQDPEYEYISATHTTKTQTTTPKVSYLRVLLPAVSSAFPLCFDVPIPKPVRILQDPGNELIIYGWFVNTAFEKIIIRHHSTVELVLDCTQPSPRLFYRDGQNTTTYPWAAGSTFVAKRLTALMTEKELDIRVGDTRIVILLNEKHGFSFLWPVLRERASGDISGLIAGKPVDFEINGLIPITLKMNNQEVTASRSLAIDHSLPSSPDVACLHISLLSAQQIGAVSNLSVS
ncbi:inter-alpha-trypsin inhibitor heavy chain H4-like [Osmerus mordax]|uniref:inter-alpha-trypsin inhibitor heavy chain H4-like n=1 Tax=Osmerus mordax TaxID=8014 RepID=UPI0035103DD2